MADYTQQWLSYTRLRNRALIAASLVFPLSFLLFLTAMLLPRWSAFEYLALVCLVVWFVAADITGRRANCFPCPRCGKYFAFKWWYSKSILLARRCVHCGLPKYAPNDGPSS